MFWHWRHLKAPLLQRNFFFLFVLADVWPPISVFKLRRENKQGNIKHTPGNMVSQPSDRFVCKAYMSQQLVLIPLTAMLCLGASFPLITWLGEIRRRGEGWERGSGRPCAVEVFSNLAGCGQLDRRFEFLLTARLKFQPLKIEGNKRLGLSKQPLRVVSFPPFTCFSCPSSFSPVSARLRRALVW